MKKKKIDKTKEPPKTRVWQDGYEVGLENNIPPYELYSKEFDLDFRRGYEAAKNYLKAKYESR